MPALHLLKSPGGVDSGKTYPLDGNSVVIGRDDNRCQIVVNNSAVSRRHAVITQANGQYYLEDLRSRNKTFLNNVQVTGKVTLKPEDRIKICDYLFRFYDERNGVELPEVPGDPGSRTTVQASLAAGKRAADHLLEAQPSDRLRALLEISTTLSRTLDLGNLLPQIADTLLGVFRQADRCFVIMIDDAGRMLTRVVKTRRPGAEDARFSQTIVRKCLDSGQAYLSEDAATDTSLTPSQSIAEFRIRSVMCVPLITADGQKLGALQLDTQDIAKKFRADDLQLLTIVANLATIAVEKAQAHLALIERERDRREIEIARRVQTGFLPKSFPELSGYEFFAFYSPAMSVGGDYYDFISLPHGRVAVVLGDVAGKGVAAALLMAKLSAEVRFSMLTEADPARAVSLLNEQLIRGGIGDRFVTLALLVLDPQAHDLAVVNAGHLNPIRLRNGLGNCTELQGGSGGGPPLGVVSGFNYDVAMCPLEHGDTLIVFTDGVTDAENESGARFEMAGIHSAIQSDDVLESDCRPSLVGERIIRAVRRHAAGHAQSDDIALVCFGRTDGGPSTSSQLLPRLVGPEELADNLD